MTLVKLDSAGAIVCVDQLEDYAVSLVGMPADAVLSPSEAIALGEVLLSLGEHLDGRP